MTELNDAEKIALVVVWTGRLVLSVGHVMILSACTARRPFTQSDSQDPRTPRNIFTADLVSSLAAVIASIGIPSQPAENSRDDAPRDQGKFLVFLFLVTAPFAMVGPLLGPVHWESFQATPADFALVVGMLALAHSAVQGLLRWWSPEGVRQGGRLSLGLGASVVGVLGFDLAVRISWMTHVANAEKIALAVVWAGGLLFAIGHAIILSSFIRHSPFLRGDSPNAHTSPGVFSADAVISLACALMPTLSAAVWCRHERTSFSFPGLILIAAFIWWKFTADPIKNRSPCNDTIGKF